MNELYITTDDFIKCFRTMTSKGTHLHLRGVINAMPNSAKTAIIMLYDSEKQMNFYTFDGLKEMREEIPFAFLDFSVVDVTVHFSKDFTEFVIFVQRK